MAGGARLARLIKISRNLADEIQGHEIDTIGPDSDPERIAFANELGPLLDAQAGKKRLRLKLSDEAWDYFQNKFLPNSMDIWNDNIFPGDAEAAHFTSLMKQGERLLQIDKKLDKAGGGRVRSLLKKHKVYVGSMSENAPEKTVEVLVNPSQQEVERWAGREIDEMRMMFDKEGNTYVWDGTEAIHERIISGLGIPFQDIADSMSDTPVHPKNYSSWVRDHAEDVAVYNHLEDYAAPKVEFDPEVEFDENVTYRDKPGAGFAGGGVVRQALTKRWRIWDTHDKQFVGQPYKNKKRARTRMDKLDNEYGAYRYQVKEVEGKAGGGGIKKGITRRDVLKGIGALGATAAGAGKVAGRKGVPDLPNVKKALEANLGPRDLADVVRKGDFSTTEWKHLAKWIQDRVILLDTELKATETDEYLPNRIESQTEEIESLRRIQNAGDDTILDPEAVEDLMALVDDTGDGFLNYDVREGMSMEEGYEVAERIGRELRTSKEFMATARKEGYKAVPEPSPRVKEIFEEYVSDARIFEDRMEYNWEDLQDSYGTDWDVQEPKLTASEAKDLWNMLGGNRRGWMEPGEFAGGGSIKRSLAQLKKGPGLHEAAKEAIARGDVQQGLKLLKELQEILQLSDEEFAKMIMSEQGPPRPKTEMVSSPNDPIGSGGRHPMARPGVAERNPLRLPQEELIGEEALPNLQEAKEQLSLDALEMTRLQEIQLEKDRQLVADFPFPEKKAGGGPIKGGLIQAREAFARRAGKMKNEGLDIPEGFDSFYTKDAGNHTEIIGVRKDGSEMNVGNIGGHPDHGLFAQQMAGAYNTGGFSDLPITPVSLTDVFGQEAKPKADVDNRLMEMLHSGELPLEIDDLAGVPEGYRLRSFQEHLENLESMGNLDEMELADLGIQGLRLLNQADYENLMDDLHRAGLDPEMYERLVKNRESEWKPDVIAEITKPIDPSSLKSLKQVIKEMGLAEGLNEEDMSTILQRLGEKFDVDPETAMTAPANRQQTIDVRRLSMDELNTLNKQGILDENIYDELSNNMVTMEEEFQDIIMDMDGEWPDEVDIVPSLYEPETYTIRAKFLDSNRTKMYDFDPMNGPRESIVTPEEFKTVREHIMPDEPTTTKDMVDPGGVDLTEVHEGIATHLEGILETEYDVDIYLDEFDLHPDPDQPGAYYAKGVVLKEIDTNETVGPLRDFHFDNQGNMVELPPGDIPEFAEGGHVKKDDKTAMDYLKAVGRSMAGAIPGTSENFHQFGEDIGEGIYKKGAYPLAGAVSQWWGVNPTTGEFEYAGPGADAIHGRGRPPYPSDMLMQIDPEEHRRQYEAWRDWKDPGETGAIPGIIDETALLPAMPQMIEMLSEMDEMQTDPNYEPDIPAPDFALHAAERAEENWTRALEKFGLPEPEGFVENALISGGMMAAQLPLPSSMLGAAKRLPRALMPKGARAAHVLGDLLREAPDAGKTKKTVMSILGSGPEFFFPTIEPSVSNYMMGALFGGTLMTWAGSQAEQMELDMMLQDVNSTKGEEQMEAVFELRRTAADPDHPEQELAIRSLEYISGLAEEDAKRLEQEDAKRISDGESMQEMLERLRDADLPPPMAGGGLIKKFTRRDVLKGLGATAATAGAAGKMAGRAGLDPTEGLENIQKALDVPAAAIKTASHAGAPFRRVGEIIMKDSQVWRKEGDIEMIEMYDRDIADYNKVADALEAGDYDTAGTIYDKLDSASREMIYELDSPTELAARRSLTKAQSDYEGVEFEDLDFEDTEMLIDEGKEAFERGGHKGLEEYAASLEKDHGVLATANDWEMEIPELEAEMDVRRAEWSAKMKAERDAMIQPAQAPHQKLRGWTTRRDRILKIINDRRRAPDSEMMEKHINQWDDLLAEMEELDINTETWEDMHNGHGFAGGGKIRTGISRRDVLKGIGAAAGTAVAGGKAATKTGLDPTVATPAIKAALKAVPAKSVAERIAQAPTATFNPFNLADDLKPVFKKIIAETYDDASSLPEKERRTMYRDDEYYDLVAMDEDLHSGEFDTPYDKSRMETLENALEFAMDEADEVEAAQIKTILDSLRTSPELPLEEFFEQWQRTSWDKPSAAWEYAERKGVKDFPEINMRELDPEDYDALKKLFDDANEEIPEILIERGWDT